MEAALSSLGHLFYVIRTNGAAISTLERFA